MAAIAELPTKTQLTTFCIRDTGVGRPHRCNVYKERCIMSTTAETGEVTGTKDKDYNLIWYTEKCLDNALRLETYVKDAERDGDDEVAELFRKAQADSRKGAEAAKQLLAKRL